MNGPLHGRNSGELWYHLGLSERRIITGQADEHDRRLMRQCRAELERRDADDPSWLHAATRKHGHCSQ